GAAPELACHLFCAAPPAPCGSRVLSSRCWCSLVALFRVLFGLVADGQSPGRWDFGDPPLVDARVLLFERFPVRNFPDGRRGGFERGHFAAVQFPEFGVTERGADPVVDLALFLVERVDLVLDFGAAAEILLELRVQLDRLAGLR